MKTIAATAMVLTLTASAFAAEPQKPNVPEAEKAQAPIVLTATQLDGVTAGVDPYKNFKFIVSFDGDATLGELAITDDLTINGPGKD